MLNNFEWLEEDDDPDHIFAFFPATWGLGNE